MKTEHGEYTWNIKWKCSSNFIVLYGTDFQINVRDVGHKYFLIILIWLHNNKYVVYSAQFCVSQVSSLSIMDPAFSITYKWPLSFLGKNYSLRWRS